MPVYELINPSDPYTFEADDIRIAGFCAAYLSTGFGARRVGDGAEESTPVLIGWGDWLKEQGITKEFVQSNATKIADAFDSFLIGDAKICEDVKSMLAELPPEKREAWRANRQDRHRPSMNQIGEAAYAAAKHLRAKLEEKGGA